MNRNRLAIGLALALLLAFLLSAFVYHQFKRLAAASAPVMPTRHIVVAAEPLQLGTRLDPSKLRTIPWPASEPLPGMFTSIEECANRALITSLAANEPILETKLAPVQAGEGLSVTIPEGMRAVSVAVNDVVGVAGFVTPGTMVDILVTGTPMGSPGGTAVTETILENIRVLAAGQKMEQDRGGKPQNVPVITLLVTPEQAEKLTLASTQGKIQLSLRNTVDTKAANPPPVLQSSLFASASTPVTPSASKRAVHKEPPPAPYEIEIIVGNKREVKNFPNP